MASNQRTARTYHQEKWRSVCTGILDTAANTFLLLIAVRSFHAGAWAKAFLASGASVGLLMSPFVVHLAQKRGWPACLAVPRAMWLGSCACVIAAITPLAWTSVYVTAGILAVASVTASIPLMTQVYQDNYPPEARGRFYSRTVMLRIAASILFAGLAGPFLEPNPTTWNQFLGDWAVPIAETLLEYPHRFRALLLVFAMALGLSGWAVRRIPCGPVRPPRSEHPLHALCYVKSDVTFRNTLVAWMLMGFANLAMLPLRIEYLGNPIYGLAKSAAEISFLTIVVPNIARLFISPAWGWLFDRVNFFAMRIILNLGFALGIAAFFTSNTFWGLILGAVIYGISTAGGDVAWGLWVTKITTPDRVADYMSVHTFFTGIRGVLAPMTAFQLLAYYTPATMGWMAGALIVLATVILVPEMVQKRNPT